MAFDLTRLALHVAKAVDAPSFTPERAVELAARDAAYEERMRNPSTLDKIGNFLPVLGPIALGAVAGAGIAGTFGGAAGAAATKLTSTALAPAPPPPPRSAIMLEGNGFDWGQITTGLINAATAYQQQRAAAAQVAGPVAAPGMTNIAWPAVIPRVMSSLGMGGVVAAGGAVVRAGSRLIQTAIGNISRKRVVAIAKTLGIQGAATALGIGAVEIAQMVLDEGQRRGRRGGITSAQMRTTRRTIGKVMGLHRQIAAACTSARAGRPGGRARRAPYCPPPKVIVTKR